MKILLLEDNPLFTIEVERLVDDLGYQIVASFDSGEKAIEFLNENKPDLLLTDIKLKGNISGVDVANLAAQKKIPIIFFTAFAEKEIYEEAMAQVPSAFLYKPFAMENLKAAIDIATLNIQKVNSLEKNTPEENHIFIKKRSEIVKLPYTELLMIEADGNYCTLNTADKKFVLKRSLKKITADLDPKQFVRIHRNYTVQIKAIKSVDYKTNILKIGDKTLPVGRNYWKQLLSLLKTI